MKFLILILFTTISYAHDHGGGNASIGKGKGVESFDEDDGFVLSKEAIKRLGIVASDLGSQKGCNLKSAQVISALDKKLIYIKRAEKYKAVSVNCNEVNVGDLMVTKGAEFLRVIEMDLTGGEEVEGDEHKGEDGHGHSEEEGHHD